jgi:hypothetical protein
VCSTLTGPGEFESAARRSEAIRGKLWVSWDELLAVATSLTQLYTEIAMQT